MESPPRRLLGALGLTLLLFAAPRTAIAARPPAAPSPQWQLWKINADGTGLAPLGETPGWSCGSAQWSPDGTQIAFDTRRTSEQLIASQIGIIRTDGADFRRIGPGGMPSWSPDGTQLVIHTYDNPQTMVVMKADGTGRETILGHWGSPRWLPTGNRIALIGVDRGLAIFDLATGTEHNILRGPHSMMPGFAVSPDGRQFCFGEANGGVWLATLDDRIGLVSPKAILAEGEFYHASWSPDGKKLVFARKAPDITTTTWTSYLTTTPARSGANEATATTEPLHQLFMFDVKSGKPPVPLAGQNTERSNTNPAWSPDGKTIIFSSLISPSQQLQ